LPTISRHGTILDEKFIIFVLGRAEQKKSPCTADFSSAAKSNSKLVELQLYIPGPKQPNNHNKYFFKTHTI
jgi:hypothetical protein